MVAVAVAEPDARVACAALLAAYLLNNVALLSFASLVEKRRLAFGDERSLRFTPGLTEGTETIVAYVAFCLRPVTRRDRRVGRSPAMVLDHGRPAPAARRRHPALSRRAAASSASLREAHADLLPDRHRRAGRDVRLVVRARPPAGQTHVGARERRRTSDGGRGDAARTDRVSDGLGPDDVRSRASVARSDVHRSEEAGDRRGARALEELARAAVLRRCAPRASARSTGRARPPRSGRGSRAAWSASARPGPTRSGAAATRGGWGRPRRAARRAAAAPARPRARGRAPPAAARRRRGRPTERVAHAAEPHLIEQRPGARAALGCGRRRPPAAAARRCRRPSRCGSSRGSWKTTAIRRRCGGTRVMSRAAELDSPSPAAASRPGDGAQQRGLPRPARPGQRGQRPGRRCRGRRRAGRPSRRARPRARGSRARRSSRVAPSRGR